MYWLRGMIHPTWQLTTACAGLVVGVTLARVWSGFASWPWLVLGIACVILAIARSRRLLIVLALAGGVLVGLFRGGVVQAHLNGYALWYGQSVTLTGKVAEDVVMSGSSGYSVQLSGVRIEGNDMEGRIFITTGDEGALLRRSDEIVAKGLLREGFGNFVGVVYRAEIVKAARPSPGDIALTVRDGFADSVRRGIDEPGASLGVGFLLGQKSSLPSHIVEVLQVAGLTHIVVASGYNLMILVRMTRRVFEKVSRYLSVISGGGLVVSFVAMTGMTPSMSRAGLVAMLGLAAWYVGRKFHPVTLLVIAAAVTVIVEPSSVWGDVGWMLSFAAFAGVMLVAPILSAYLSNQDKLPFVLRLFIETTSAQIVTLPIILAVFGNLSVVSIAANLLVLPAIPFVMLLTFFGGLTGFVGGVLQQAIAWPADIMLKIIIWIVERCAEIPGAQISWQLDIWSAIALYTAIIGACLYMKHKSGYNLRTSSAVD